MSKTVVAGIPTSTLGRPSLAHMVFAEPSERDGPRIPRLLFDINGHAIALYYSDRNYRAALDKADVVHADGQSIVFASRLLCSLPIEERTATTDIIHDFAAEAVRTNRSFFLLGSDEETNAGCAAKLQELYPRLKVAGRRNGYFGPQDEDAIFDTIEASGADIVWVGLGKPLEQIFAARARARLTCSWIITCGGCFNFITDEYKRAPKWVQNFGLEWLHRLIKRPHKLFWRYVVTNPIATYWILKASR
ncbi:MULTISPECIES: WecB/TagA/CpsF family glycosyltransferase [unclassified Rhizobium]|uniref:WecB/TagA/CpsF family glycosyltransferase n=1 Tax=unclassified Rhizobium TaxID=2613769 RepID=UPI0013870706|nr:MULTISPECIES: WecB/TagA/CpsF family glycosyltransferase [unclassified Rhizobium]MBO9099414.1 WecB/TagA/CpsF family glycosyltransferase [Rhizobium sp. L58/93]QXZ87100.1 WecB/TagA/CpsF family glycosyltransferase [Rhizobium sp. K1/93]QXZ92866.1 WecB/TagA/CpsF family glycosyltransferase [Rhizobium sp. K15/93]